MPQSFVCCQVVRDAIPSHRKCSKDSNHRTIEGKYLNDLIRTLKRKGTFTFENDENYTCCRALYQRCRSFIPSRIPESIAETLNQSPARFSDSLPSESEKYFFYIILENGGLRWYMFRGLSDDVNLHAKWRTKDESSIRSLEENIPEIAFKYLSSIMSKRKKNSKSDKAYIYIDVSDSTKVENLWSIWHRFISFPKLCRMISVDKKDFMFQDLSSFGSLENVLDTYGVLCLKGAMMKYSKSSLCIVYFQQSHLFMVQTYDDGMEVGNVVSHSFKLNEDLNNLEATICDHVQEWVQKTKTDRRWVLLAGISNPIPTLEESLNMTSELSNEPFFTRQEPDLSAYGFSAVVKDAHKRKKEEDSSKLLIKAETRKVNKSRKSDRLEHKSTPRTKKKKESIITKAQGALYEKRRVCKLFDEEIYFGSVVEYIPGSDRVDDLWYIKYDDNDAEDFNADELLEALSFYELKKDQDYKRLGTNSKNP